MSMLERALVAAMLVLPGACGVGDDADVTTLRQSAVGGCTNPTNGMVITTNTTLCAGNFPMATPSGGRPAQGAHATPRRRCSWWAQWRTAVR